MVSKQLNSTETKDSVKRVKRYEYSLKLEVEASTIA